MGSLSLVSRDSVQISPARRYEVADWQTWANLAEERGWTDGLPVYPPEESAVVAILDHLGAGGATVVGRIPPRQGLATLERIAANCVMAGCRPEEVPVVLAALDAMLEPSFNLNGVQITTHPCEPLTIIAGPVVETLCFAHAEAAFGGGGSRPNGAVGRAIRLILWNLGGGYPGRGCKKILGQPGRFAYCIAEDPEGNPWESILSEGGLATGESGVAVFACDAPHGCGAFFTTELVPQRLLDVVAGTMAGLGNNNVHHARGQILVALSPRCAQMIAEQGWSKTDVRKYLFEKARNPIWKLRPRSSGRPNVNPAYWTDWWPRWVDQSNEDTEVAVVEDWRDIHILVTGAVGLPWAAVCPGWGPNGGFLTARPIKSGAADSRQTPSGN